MKKRTAEIRAKYNPNIPEFESLLLKNKMDFNVYQDIMLIAPKGQAYNYKKKYIIS